MTQPIITIELPCWDSSTVVPSHTASHTARQSRFVSSRRNATFRLVSGLGDRDRNGRCPPILQSEHKLYGLEICKIGCFLNGPLENVGLTSDAGTLAWLLFPRRPLVVDYHDAKSREPTANNCRDKRLIQEIPETFANLWCMNCCFIHESGPELLDAGSPSISQAHSTHCRHIALTL